MSLNKGGLFRVLFGLVFLAVGVIAGCLSLRTLALAETMRTWKETPASVLSCSLNVSRNSKGGASYRVSADYQYEVNGLRHTGNRVSVHAGADNIGRFNQRLYDELKRCKDRNLPITCWVNPKDPAEAILNRTPRTELLIFMQLFVLAFGGSGLSILLAGLPGLLQPSSLPEGESGLGQIRMRGGSTHRVTGFLAVVWNAYVGYFLWKVSGIIGLSAMPWYLWIVAVPGLISALVAGYFIGRFRKFGGSVFEMSPLPGVLGGPVSGTVRIPAKVETETGFELVLQCVHQYTSGSGKHRSTHRDVLWEDSRHIDGMVSFGDETMLPVRFTVPYDKPASTGEGGRNGYYWRLNVTASTPGIDYKAVFDVPVRHTPQSASGYVPQHMPDPHVKQEPVTALVAREGLSLKAGSNNGFELIFPAARGGLSLVPSALFILVWSLPCFLLWTGSRTPGFMAVIFTLIDVMLVVCLLNALLVSRGIVVDPMRRDYVLWRRFAGLPKRERRIPFDNVTDIRSARGTQSGNTMFYQVVLTVHEGLPVLVGSGLKMWNDAEGMARLLRAAMKPEFVLNGFLV